MTFRCPVEMPENGRTVAIVEAVFYRDSSDHHSLLGIKEFVVQDKDGNQWNAYPNELHPVTA